jgi:multiple sugar transport system substrate-binding protein
LVALPSLPHGRRSSLGSGKQNSHRRHREPSVLSGWGANPDELKLLKAVIRGFEKTYPADQRRLPADHGRLRADDAREVLGAEAAGRVLRRLERVPRLGHAGPARAARQLREEEQLLVVAVLPSLLNGFKYKGKIYGYPKDWSPLAMEVNTALAQKAGVNPAKITSWATLTAAAKKLQPQMGSGAKAICLNPSWDRALAFVYQNKGSFLNASKTKSTINSPAAKAAMDYYVGLIKQGLADIPAKLGVDWCGAALGKEKAAIIFEGNWLFPYMQSTFPDVKFSTQQMIRNKQHGNLAFTVSYSMAKDAPNKDAAWQLIRYLTGRAGMKTWTSKGLALPSRKDVKPVVGRQPFLADAANSHPWQFAPKFSQVIDTANAELSSVIEGKQSTSEMLKKIESTANDTLK